MDHNKDQSIVQAAFLPVVMANRSALLVLSGDGNEYCVAFCGRPKAPSLAVQTIFCFAQSLDKMTVDETKVVADLLAKVAERECKPKQETPQDGQQDVPQAAAPETTSPAVTATITEEN